MEKEIKIQPLDRLYINRNIQDCWQLVKLAHQKKKEERENRRIIKNKS